jgi:NAD-dependent SIR2 family protein deacetylase
MTDVFQTAAALIQEADGLLVTAGAGMGIDSGLPDFRGPQGFWKAYPGLAKAHMQFQDIASPDAFKKSPELAWGFYGHRLALYRKTEPHRGFEILRNIADRMPHGSFVYTSNVDGQFQKAGFSESQVKECHGSIHWLQCLDPCSEMLWPANIEPVVDEETCRLTSPLPRCPQCKDLARPNIMMFHDWGWHEERTRAQGRRYVPWRSNITNLVIVEMGAGVDIPSVRLFSEDESRFGTLIRINPREAQRPARSKGVSIPMGALTALEKINDALYDRGFWEGA